MSEHEIGTELPEANKEVESPSGDEERAPEAPLQPAAAGMGTEDREFVADPASPPKGLEGHIRVQMPEQAAADKAAAAAIDTDKGEQGQNWVFKGSPDPYDDSKVIRGEGELSHDQLDLIKDRRSLGDLDVLIAHAENTIGERDDVEVQEPEVTEEPSDEESGAALLGDKAPGSESNESPDSDEE